MTLEAFRQIPDQGNNQWIPAISIRPHHFYDLLNSIPQALQKEGQEPQFLANQATGFIRSASVLLGKSPAYISDVLGDTQESTKKRAQDLGTFFKKLRELPDDAIVQFDAKKDGLCDSCAIGKHCTVLNYEDDTNFIGLEAEAEMLKEIQEELSEEGMLEGTDYIFEPTTHVFFDHHGQGIDNPNPEVKFLTFNSMLIKAGALRKIC